jgi:SAM-dependent methyltransferase
MLTWYQFRNLERLCREGLADELDVDGNPLGIREPVSRLVFAVTSANHSNTRRNPVELMYRAMAIQDFSRELPTATFVFAIEDQGLIGDFARYVVQRINHEAGRLFTLSPENTAVVCSTPVMEMYEREGYRILPAELLRRENGRYIYDEKERPNPWVLVEAVGRAAGPWSEDPFYQTHAHPASRRIWSLYDIGGRVRTLFDDSLLGDDGDLTETRDYNSYVRQMDEIAELKFRETVPHVRPGRIGDIGCAVGSWLKQAAETPALRESDFYGVEISRRLYQICLQRKENGDFASPYVFFSRRNAAGPLFPKGSMDTIHSSSLTHDIESYGGRRQLLEFIANRYKELRPGGVWINRDVIGPQDGDRLVYLGLDGGRSAGRIEPAGVGGRETPSGDCEGLSENSSSYDRFVRFASDFRRDEGYRLQYTVGGDRVRLRLEDACEFMSKMDYVDNWVSEMHERFCFWSYRDWEQALKEAGFRVLESTAVYTNSWIVENRLRGRVELFAEDGEPLEYPPTHVLLVAAK